MSESARWLRLAPDRGEYLASARILRHLCNATAAFERSGLCHKPGAAPQERRGMKSRPFLTAEAAVVAFALACVPATAQVTFQRFPVENGFINDMSADGSVVVGKWVAPTSKSNQAWRWTAAGDVQDLGGNMDTVYISRDGKTIAGSANDSNRIQQAAIWQSGTNWKLLGGIPGGVPYDGTNLSGANGVSADGSVIVGNAYTSDGAAHAFRWDAGNGMVDLGILRSGKGLDSSAVSTSADGNTIVGFDESAAYQGGVVPNMRIGAIFWNGLERLLHPFGWAGEARATNDNGSIIVGRTHPLLGGHIPNAPPPYDGFQQYVATYMYTAWDGRFKDLGAVWYSELDPKVAYTEYTSLPRGVSDDGSVVGARTGSFLVAAAVWTHATGMVRVAQYLTANGVTDHLGWQLTDVSYVSPDGKRIAGTGIDPQLRAYSWIVTLR